MSMERGSLSINSENIFPIIKKWLYSDHDIFMRELISNGCDAITKLKKLELIGEAKLPENHEFKIKVSVNQEDKTIRIIDNGIGMTADEVKQYINQIAFSGAEAFLAQYKDKASEDQIIGHFGLGFYSAFMVAHKVTIDTLSYKEDSVPVHWESEEGIDFEMSEGTRTEMGTEITLYLNEDSYEFSNEYRAKEVIEKYCSFMPVEIFLENETAEPEYETIDAEDVKVDDVIIERIQEEDKERVKIEKRPESLSDIHPLWTKHPNECSDEEYKDFYRKVFLDYKEPLFWIHLNMDYPFNLKGILYFPRINPEIEPMEGTIKLYNNQVFIADNIKEVIPEFLMVLKGVIDCPDLPLNVSRSALQNDGFVNKIADYICKKVADKLSGMCKTKREEYEGYWDNISPFIKYGCLRDEKFCDKMTKGILYKNLGGKYFTLEEYVKKDTPEAEEDTKTTIYYVTDENQQSQYINMFRKQEQDAVILNHGIDSAFITLIEQKNDKVTFQRIDAAVNENAKEEIAENDKASFEELTNSLVEIFRKELNNEKLDVKIEKLKDESVASMITLSEQNRRMMEMMKMYGMASMGMDAESTLVLNANHPLVKYVVENKDNVNVSLICKQLYDLAMLAHKPLSPEEMTAFVLRSNEIMMMLTK